MTSDLSESRQVQIIPSGNNVFQRNKKSRDPIWTCITRVLISATLSEKIEVASPSIPDEFSKAAPVKSVLRDSKTSRR